MLFLIFIGALVMFIVIDFVGNIRSWSSRETSEIIEYYKCYSPYIVFLISPVALFLAVIASVGNMAKHLELTAIQSSGRSMFRALMPIVFFGLLFTVLSFILSETIMPESNHKRLEIMETNQQKKKNQRVKDKREFAFIDSERASWFFRYYSGIKKNGRDVSLLIKKENHLVERFDAKRIRWDIPETENVDSTTVQTADSCWIFENGYHRTFLADGSIETESFTKLPIPGIVSTRPDDLINDRQTGDEMTAKEVKHRIEVLRRSGEDTKAMETAYHYKFAGPWTNFFVLLIGAALCHRFSRSGGLSQKFGIGIFFVFSYYILIRLGLKMGENMSPWLGAYGPHILFAIIASIMLYRSFRL